MTFYGISGNNGFGVYNNEERLDNAKAFITKSVIKEFDSAYKAYEWASGYYNESQEDFDNAFYGEFSDVKLNWLLFKKEIRKQNVDNN